VESIVDPESSPIVNTAYLVNGSPINSTLPLATSTLGTSTLVVAATDVAGHTGYATSSFSFSTPTPPAGTDCVFALSATGKPALKMDTSASINVNCGVRINSNAAGAVNISGSTRLAAMANCVVGTLVKSGSASYSPALTVPCTPKADP